MANQRLTYLVTPEMTIAVSQKRTQGYRLGDVIGQMGVGPLLRNSYAGMNGEVSKLK